MKTRARICRGLLGKRLSRKPPSPLPHLGGTSLRSAVPLAGTAARHGAGAEAGDPRLRGAGGPRAGTRGGADRTRRVLGGRGSLEAALPAPPRASSGGARSLGGPGPKVRCAAARVTGVAHAGLRRPGSFRPRLPG